MTMQENSKAMTEEVIDLRQYFNVINKYKWRIGFLAFAVAIFAAVVALNMTPIYRATATLLIEAEQSKAVSFEEIVGLDSNRKEYYLTQFEILKSREIARTVVERLNLKDHEDFIAKESFMGNLKKSLPFIPKKTVSDLSPEEIADFELQGLIEAFADRLTISPVRKTQLVNISFESSDSKLAALVANTVGETFIEHNRIAKLGLTQNAAGSFTSSLSELEIKLQKSEERLQNYREKENLVDVEGVSGLNSADLKQTRQLLVDARNETTSLESIMRVINEYGRNNIDKLESMPEINAQKVIQDVKKTLVEAELEHSELIEVYGPKHPKFIVSLSKINKAREELSSQIMLLVISAEKELKTSKRNVIALEKELVKIRAKHQVISGKENEYRKLNRDVESNRAVYDSVLARFKETEVTQGFNSAVARFTDRAYRPQRPVKPKKPLIVILAFIATLGLGVVVAFVVESLNDTFKSAGEIENKLFQRMLGLLPLIETKKDTVLSPHYFFDEKGKKFAESVRTLRTSFVLTQLEKDSKIVEVTSSVPGEGKTTVAINLAFSLGQMKKTILIDADMRKPSIGKRFNIPAYHPGLANLIAGTEQFKKCIYKDAESGITVMPCGQVPSNPLELLSSKQFVKILDFLSTHYDHVIIDTAPISAVSDPLVIAQHTDSVIYVVKSDETRIGVVKNGIDRLIEGNANLAGVVLNQVDTKKMSQTDYYHGYYDSYSYGEKES